MFEFRPVFEQVKRFRVSQCIDIIGWFIVNDVSYGQFNDFTADGSWYIADLNNFCWNKSEDKYAKTP